LHDPPAKKPLAWDLGFGSSGQSSRVPAPSSFAVCMMTMTRLQGYKFFQIEKKQGGGGGLEMEKRKDRTESYFVSSPGVSILTPLRVATIIKH